MANVYLFLAKGFEEIEALTMVDVLRRGKQDVLTVSITDEEKVMGAHAITVKADRVWEEIDFSDADMLLLPGGMPGTSNLWAFRELCDVVQRHVESGKLVGAICAAPMILGGVGVLRGRRRATCYPGFEHYLIGARCTDEVCTVDDNIITGNGPAAALPFSLAVLKALKGEEVANTVAEQMMFNKLMEKK